MRRAVTILLLSLAAAIPHTTARSLLHPAASRKPLQRLENDTQIDITASVRRHEPHLLRLPAFPGAWGLDAAANLSVYRSGLLAANARAFRSKENLTEDRDEKYERFKLYEPHVTCPPGEPAAQPPAARPPRRCDTATPRRCRPWPGLEALEPACQVA
jgi:hypothetical protein